ncbi:MAG: HAMP domain-containing sensor histidine kinase [Acidobacteriota bacterium]|nr:HAMP domain-containing sensor histidine kinase [Acidobacteriota bacterium]
MADSTLPTLLSLASHELRGPTGVVRGYLRLLEQDATLGERPRRVMVEMTRATERLAALLDELTELAHLKDGRIKLALKRTSLRSVLNQAVQAVELPDHFEADLDVVAPADVRLRLDEARMRVVFCTLIATLARVQSGASGFDLRLVKGRTTAQVVVQPRTLGRGTLEERPLDISRGGTGLLLPIADAVVQAHGGRLRERWLAGRFAGFVVKL